MSTESLAVSKALLAFTIAMFVNIVPVATSLTVTTIVRTTLSPKLTVSSPSVIVPLGVTLAGKVSVISTFSASAEPLTPTVIV